MSEAAIATIPTILASSVVAGIVTALLTQLLLRRATKKAPKTVERAKAYEALLIHIWQRSQDGVFHRRFSDEPDLRAILAKLSLYGESNVVEAAANIFCVAASNNSSIPNTAAADLVREMRRSIMTGTRSEVVSSIQRLMNTSCPPL